MFGGLYKILLVHLALASDGPCPERRELYIADSVSGAADVSLNGPDQVSTITLPAGVYNYTYAFGLQNCTTTINVLGKSVYNHHIAISRFQ